MPDSEIYQDLLAGVLLVVTILNVVALIWIAHSLLKIRNNLKRAREAIDATNKSNDEKGGGR